MISQYSQKGKDKVLSGYAFNEDGVLSLEAIKLIDSGNLKAISKAFGKTVLDMEEEIFAGIFVKDVLESALKGTLGDLLSQIPLKNPEPKGLQIGTNHPNLPRAAETQGCARLAEDQHIELMDVEETMIEMALYEELAGGGNMA